MASIVLERKFDPALTKADLERMFERVGPCLDERNARWIRSYLSGSGDRMICLFEAPDVEAVREGFRMADLPFESVWRGDVLVPGTD